MMTLSCNVKSKEKRVRCEKKYKIERMSARENIGIKFRNKA